MKDPIMLELRRCSRLPLIALALIAMAVSGCGGAGHKKIQRAGEALRFELAEMYVQKGAKEQAIPLLRRIIAEKPEHLPARVLYASVLRDLGLYPQARAELGRVLEREPKFAPAHAALGILYDLQRDFDLAKKHHHKATSYAPSRADYFNNLGFSYFLTEQYEDAVKHFQHALALDPGLALAYNNLGFAFGRLGQLDKAETTFRTALGEAGALYNMALIHDQRGDVRVAREYRERAFASDPELRSTYLSSLPNTSSESSQ